MKSTTLERAFCAIEVKDGKLTPLHKKLIRGLERREKVRKEVRRKRRQARANTQAH